MEIEGETKAVVVKGHHRIGVVVPSEAAARFEKARSLFRIGGASRAAVSPTKSISSLYAPPALRSFTVAAP